MKLTTMRRIMILAAGLSLAHASALGVIPTSVDGPGAHPIESVEVAYAPDVVGGQMWGKIACWTCIAAAGLAGGPGAVVVTVFVCGYLCWHVYN